MTRGWTTKSFKSGNSVALRVPAAVGIVPGEEWRLVEEGKGFRLEKAVPVKRKIDVDAFWGKSPGLKLFAPEDRLFEERPVLRPMEGDGSPRVKYLLDSNIIIRSFDATGGPLRERIAACDEGDLVTSPIAYAEVALGSFAGKPPEAAALAGLVTQVPVLDFDFRAAQSYARLAFRRGGYDRLIAAHALSRDLILVTDNERHFTDIPGLRVENWMLPL